MYDCQTRKSRCVVFLRQTNFGPECDYPRSALKHSQLCQCDAIVIENSRIYNYLKGGEKMKIDLTSREVPPANEQPGVFADVVPTIKTDKRGKKFNYLVLVGELKATKSSGKRFVATAGYNLDDTRGINRLKEDLMAWRASDTVPDLSDFDPVAEFLGKGFLAEPTIVDKDGKRQVQFSGFRPYTGEPITVSPDFVRAKPANESE